MNQISVVYIMQMQDKLLLSSNNGIGGWWRSDYCYELSTIKM